MTYGHISADDLQTTCRGCGKSVAFLDTWVFPDRNVHKVKATHTYSDHEMRSVQLDELFCTSCTAFLHSPKPEFWGMTYVGRGIVLGWGCRIILVLVSIVIVCIMAMFGS